MIFAEGRGRAGRAGKKFRYRVNRSSASSWTEAEEILGQEPLIEDKILCSGLIKCAHEHIQRGLRIEDNRLLTRDHRAAYVIPFDRFNGHVLHLHE